MRRLTWKIRTLPERALNSLIFGVAIMLFVCAWNVLTRGNDAEEQRVEFISSLRETSTELEKFEEIEAVYFSAIEPTKELDIKLKLAQPVSEEFLSTIGNETRRILLHALTDYSKNPADATKIFSKMKINVEILP